jgi:hypothetical protein
MTDRSIAQRLEPRLDSAASRPQVEYGARIEQPLLHHLMRDPSLGRPVRYSLVTHSNEPPYGVTQILVDERHIGRLLPRAFARQRGQRAEVDFDAMLEKLFPKVSLQNGVTHRYGRVDIKHGFELAVLTQPRRFFPVDGFRENHRTTSQRLFEMFDEAAEAGTPRFQRHLGADAEMSPLRTAFAQLRERRAETQLRKSLSDSWSSSFRQRESAHRFTKECLEDLFSRSLPTTAEDLSVDQKDAIETLAQLPESQIPVGVRPVVEQYFAELEGLELEGGKRVLELEDGLPRVATARRPAEPDQDVDPEPSNHGITLDDVQMDDVVLDDVELDSKPTPTAHATVESPHASHPPEMPEVSADPPAPTPVLASSLDTDSLVDELLSGHDNAPGAHTRQPVGKDAPRGLDPGWEIIDPGSGTVEGDYDDVAIGINGTLDDVELEDDPTALNEFDQHRRPDPGRIEPGLGLGF